MILTMLSNGYQTTGWFSIVVKLNKCCLELTRQKLEHGPDYKEPIK